MGNQREIRQVEPREGLGVVIRIRPKGVEQVRTLVSFGSDRFYTYFQPAGVRVAFPNLDGPDVDLGILPVCHLTIQSGGKMWCGYENFITHIRELSPYLEDALFYVGDEVDYIDEFRLRASRLEYRRVHQGCWLPVEEYVRTARQLADGPRPT